MSLGNKQYTIWTDKLPEDCRHRDFWYKNILMIIFWRCLWRYWISKPLVAYYSNSDNYSVTTPWHFFQIINWFSDEKGCMDILLEQSSSKYFGTLQNFSTGLFTTSETWLNILYGNLCIRVTSRVTERFKSWYLRKLENIGKILNFGRDTA